jgi:hypothetical protein
LKRAVPVPLSWPLRQSSSPSPPIRSFPHPNKWRRQRRHTSPFLPSSALCHVPRLAEMQASPNTKHARYRRPHRKRAPFPCTCITYHCMGAEHLQYVGKLMLAFPLPILHSLSNWSVQRVSGTPLCTRPSTALRLMASRTVRPVTTLQKPRTTSYYFLCIGTELCSWAT